VSEYVPQENPGEAAAAKGSQGQILERKEIEHFPEVVFVEITIKG
jgi:hypothetical protein